MKKRHWSSSSIIAFIVAVLFSTAIAGIDQTVQKSGNSAVMGVVVKDLTTGRYIYQRNANRLFVPASSLKMYTAAAALITLGPNFHFETSLYTDARSVQPGVLPGNLYVNFGGDPTLTSKELIALVNALRKYKIHTIRGHIVIVPPNYTAEKYPPGIAERDKIHPYGAPITPLIIDQNALSFVISSTNPGQRATVWADDPSGRVRITNQLYTKRPGTKACGLSYSLDNTNQLTVKGCIRPRKQAYYERIAMRDPMGYALGIVEKTLQDAGIRFKDHAYPGKLPKSAKRLEMHQSESLPTILANTLKPSNNILANALYLKVGQSYWRDTATWQNSGQAIKQILQKYAGVPMQTASIVDGAGLSRNNRVTPMQFVALLTHMQRKFMLSDDFISALPVPGQKGTMAHRYIAPMRQQQHIHAKTGTIRGVVSLAGYLTSANHHTLAFAFMTNSTSPLVYSSDNFMFPAWKYRKLEDEICRHLLNSNT